MSKKTNSKESARKRTKARLELIKSGTRGALHYLSSFPVNGQSFKYPKLDTIDVAGYRRVLILSPHPDDDVIGCGGVIGLCAERGVKVKVVYLTDGRHGNSNIPMDELIRMRRAEAKSALGVFGYDDTVFLNLPDMGLECTEENVRTVLDIVKSFKPDAVFAPTFYEMVPDHINTARIAANVALRTRREIDWYGYEVWCPTLFNPAHHIVLVDVGAMMDKKIAAINKHRSQTDVCDYAPKIAGLNAYRSMLAVKGINYCESFIKFNRKEFVDHAWTCGAFEKT
ncbi:MAG TPA: PIG-L deacetylase family protein [Methanomassiliicoccales archaeon]|nr:PIG-L deacetylase family protein [Methanomassiliicoccales archaeon]